MAIASSASCSTARARGDARPDSDYDIALFLRGPVDTWAEIAPLAAIEETFGETMDADISTIAFPSDGWAKRTLLMHEIRKDGVQL